ncbi:MAG: sulfotransferase domain-containing protein [archaeon]
MRSFHLVKYEDLHTDGFNQLRQIINFIGYSEIPDNIIENAVEFARFENMKKMEQEEGGKNHIMFSNDKEFVREGKFGVGKDKFSKEDQEYIQSHVNMLDDMYGYGE